MDIHTHQYKVRVSVIAAVCFTGFMMTMNISNIKRSACNRTFSLLCAVQCQPVVIEFDAFSLYWIFHQIVQYSHIHFFKCFMQPLKIGTVK